MATPDNGLLSQYCERTSPDFWAEPLNALTNGAFILAGVAIVLRLWRTDHPLRLWDLWLLMALILAVGVGSFLWHTVATRWAVLADVIPIILFIHLFLLSFLVRVARLPWWGVAGIFVLFLGVNNGVQALFPPATLNGSIFYVPTLGALLLMAAWLRWRRIPVAGDFLLAGGLFTVSLTMRSLDNALCAVFPWGLHWGWHIFNGAVLFLSTRALLEHHRWRRQQALTDSR